jgi:hypothetical protein
MYNYENILASQVQRIRDAYPGQILDESNPAIGCFLSSRSDGHPNADHGSNASLLATACYAFLCDGSDLERDDELFERIQKSIAFQRNWQRPTGLIDLISVNWESPPDTGFAVQIFAPVVAFARRLSDNNDRAAEIAETLGEFVRTAATGMIGRGFHTPNHRWVVCSALSQAMTLYPNVGAREYVDSILAETIDINADGEFTERSTGIYNAVCDRGLRFMADHLNKPELLDDVRKNLEIMTHLFHDDGTVVTSISNRQDRGTRLVPVGIAESFFDMANRDGDGRWASIADKLVAKGLDAPHSPWLIQPFAQNPEYRTAHLQRSPIPDNYTKLYPVSGLWRVKRGKLSATAATGNRTVFALRYGDVDLTAIKLSGTYINTTNFEADTIEAIPNGIRLTQHGGQRQIHQHSPGTRLPGYDLPLNKPVPIGTFGEVRGTRERWTLPTIDLTVELTEVDKGFDLCYTTEGGLDRVPVEIEFAFEAPGDWETANQVIPVSNGQSSILKSGMGIFHRGSEGISINPGSGVHRHWDMRNSEPSDDRFRVLVTLQTPVDHTIEIRYGTWSVASNSLVY